MFRKLVLCATCAALFAGSFAAIATAKDLGTELYPGEKALLEAALKEKGINSYDTGPTWANWQALFDGYQARYGIQVSFNDLGSGATVVRLD